MFKKKWINVSKYKFQNQEKQLKQLDHKVLALNYHKKKLNKILKLYNI